MTCIVGLIKKDNVYIAGDSAGVSGTDITIRKDKKIFSNDNFIFGFTSSFRMGQLLKYNLSIPEIPVGIDLYDYMVRYFIDDVRKCLSNGGYIKIKDQAERGGMFLVAVKDRLFMIQDDFQVVESMEDYMAIGCGENYALGSLYSTKDMNNPLFRIDLALRASQHFDGSVSSPFYCINSKDLEVKEMDLKGVEK